MNLKIMPIPLILKYCSLILLGGGAVQKMYDLSKALPYPQLSTNSDQVQAIKNN